jgi:phosphoribosylanthranilate isomerase
MRTRIKICGITRPEDGLAVAEAGGDAIGLVFYGPSPRNVTIEQAQAVVAALPPFVTVVGLFVNATDDEIREVLDAVPLGLLQFHGDEPAGLCGGYGLPYIKALRMAPGLDVAATAGLYRDAQGILLDAYQPGVAGGTGEVFDWQAVPEGLKKPIILAGGLTAGNVGEGITQVLPYAVDVSGGVEAAKGIKDINKISAFVDAVRSA